MECLGTIPSKERAHDMEKGSRTIHSAARSTQSRPQPRVVPFWLVHLVPIFSVVTMLQELSYFETMSSSNVSILKKSRYETYYIRKNEQYIAQFQVAACCTR